jgi:hypothetical protein
MLQPFGEAFNFSSHLLLFLRVSSRVLAAKKIDGEFLTKT